MTTESKPETIPTWGSSAGSSQLVRPTDDEIKQGWPAPLGDQKGTKPKRQRMNWIFNWISGWYNYFVSRGTLMTWDASITYGPDARIVGSNGKTYKALAENLNKDPVSDDGSTWIRWGYGADDVATATSVGLVKPDNVSVYIDNNGKLSSSSSTVPTMTLTNNGIGRPDGVTITVDGTGKFSAATQGIAPNVINTTGFLFKLTGAQNFDFPLNRNITLDSSYQFRWGNPFFIYSMAFEKGFLYNLIIYDIYSNNFSTIKVKNINIDKFDFNSYKLRIGFDFSSNNQTSVTFQKNDGTQKIGWASSHNAGNTATFLGDIFIDSYQSDPIMEKIFYSTPVYDNGAFSAVTPVLIPRFMGSSSILQDLSKIWTSGTKFCTIVLIEKTIL